jgi:hypothetical protein
MQVPWRGRNFDRTEHVGTVSQGFDELIRSTMKPLKSRAEYIRWFLAEFSLTLRWIRNKKISSSEHTCPFKRLFLLTMVMQFESPMQLYEIPIPITPIFVDDVMIGSRPPIHPQPEGPSALAVMMS